MTAALVFQIFGGVLLVGFIGAFIYFRAWRRQPDEREWPGM